MASNVAKGDLLCLIAAMAMYAQIPLAVDLLALTTNPFLMGTLYLLVHVISLHLYIYFRYRSSRGLTFTNIGSGFKRQVSQLQQTGYRLAKSRIALLLLAIPEYAYLAWAAQGTGTAVSMMLFQLWPVIFIVLSSKLMRTNEASHKSDSRRRKVRRVDYAFPSAMAFVGVALVIASKHDWTLQGLTLTSNTAAVGIAASIVGASAAAAIPYFNLSMGRHLARQIPIAESEDPASAHEHASDSDHSSDDSEEVYHILYSKLTSTRAAVPIVLSLAVFHLVSGQSNATQIDLTTLGAALWIGFSITAGAVLFRVANSRLQNPAQNAIFYFTPLVALTLLWAFGSIDVLHLDLFIMGAIVVAAANVIINTATDHSESAVHYSFRGLIFATWIAGAIVHSRDKLVDAKALAWSHENYWSLLGVLSTIFILIYSFRTSRLSNRVSLEQERIIEMVNEASELVSQEVVPHEIVDELIEGDATNSPNSSLQKYQSISAKIRHALESYSENANQRRRLSSLQRLVDSHFQSRMRAREFTEIAAMTIIAAIMCMVAVVARPMRSHPGYGSYESIFVEMFAIAFVAVVIFLLFDLVDRRNSRDARSFEYVDASMSLGSLSIVFPDATVAKWERVASLLMFFLLYAAFGYLLARKWLLVS